MSQPVVKRSDQTQFLDNMFWKKESFLNDEVIFHTIQCQKIGERLPQQLQENNFQLVGSQKNQSVSINGKKIESTEIHEMHLDRLKVTEASIISHTKRPVQVKRVLINESEPLQIDSDQAPRLIEASVQPEKVASNIVPVEDKFKKVEHEHYVFRQEVARQKNSYFFKAKDSAGLFKLGNAYYEDFKTGIHQFGFTHLGADDVQKKTILGVAAFIHYYENLKILILTPTMQDSFYGDFRVEDNRQQRQISAYPEFAYEVFHNEGLDYLEVHEVVKQSQLHKIKGVEYIIQRLVEDYDIVFYDLPHMDEKKSRYDIYFPILQMIQNVSFIVSLDHNTFKEIDELRKYFVNYKIKIKGVVLNNKL